MGRKSSLIVLIILITGLAVLIWFMHRSSQDLAKDPYSLIPSDALFFFETDNLPGLLSSVTDDNGLFTELSKISEMEKLAIRIKYLRDLLNRNDISGFFENNKSILSFHPYIKGRIVPLLSMNVPVSSGSMNIIKTLRSATGNRLFERKEGDLRIFGIPYMIKEEADTLYILLHSGLLLSSTSSGFLKRLTVQNPSGEDIRSLAGVSKIMGAAGKKKDKVFIIFRNFAQVIENISNAKNPGLANSFKRLAGSTEGDIYINENGIVFSGYAESADSSDFLFRFKTHRAGKLNTREVLPSDVVLFETMPLPFQKVNPAENSGINDSTRVMAEKLLPFTGNEITLALFISGKDKSELSRVRFVELSNRSMAEKLISDKLAETTVYQPDDQTKIPVYKSPYRNLTSALSGGFSSPSEDSLIAFIDNFMITGNSYQAITKVLYDNILKKTLVNDLAYRDFENTLPSQAACYFFCKPSEIIGYLSAFFNDKIIEVLEANETHLARIQAIGYQLAASNEMIYNTLSVKFGEEMQEESGAEWQTLLDTVASIKPFFFTNHNTGAKEIFIQDLKNNAYLVNSAGRVLWKVPLNEKISGPVYMIDYYKNGKYQLLFASRNWLHLIDRNGNYVERYPVRLRAVASSPPSMFDYDGNGEYRIFIAGEDKLIYAFDKSGNVVKGWKPFMTNGIVKDPLKFFRVSGKDYLVAADNTNIYFIDRTGNTRIKVKEPVTKAGGSEIRLNTGSEPGIVLSSPEGVIQEVSFDGNVRKFDVGKFTVDHSFDFFDVDGDGFGEYLFIDRGILYLYDNDRSPVFEKDFGTTALEGPISFIFSSTDRKIGIFDKNKKQIFLVDKNGKVMNGFPLRGASVFSIGKLSDKSGFHLIVGGDDNFLYNYKLNTESK